MPPPAPRSRNGVRWSSAARKPVHQNKMSASNRLPSGQLTPPAMVEERVRRGLPPRSVVSVTGLPLTPASREAREADVLHRFPMFAAIDATAALPSSLVNSRSTPYRRAPGHPPVLGGHRRDLHQQLHSGDPATDHHHPPAGKPVGARVVVGVQLPTGEVVTTRIPRPERTVPAAGGGNQPGPVLDHPAHRHRPADVQRELLLVAGEVVRHRLPGRHAAVDIGHHRRRQLPDAVDSCHRQRWPAVPPGSAGSALGIQHQMIGAAVRQVIGSGQPGLSCPNHQDVRPHHPARLR